MIHKRFSVVRYCEEYDQEFPVWTFSSRDAAEDLVRYLRDHSESTSKGDLSIKEWKVTTTKMREEDEC
jgi:hypothetical protein